MRSGLLERHRVGVLDEVGELAAVLLTDRGVQRDRLLRDPEHLDDPLLLDPDRVGDLGWLGGPAELLDQVALRAEHAIHRVRDMDRYADRPRLVGQGSRDRLPDPPGRVRRELEALGVVELLDRADQAQVSLLDQVEHRHAATDVPLGDRDHEAEVRLDDLLLGALAGADERSELPSPLGVDRARFVELGSGEEPNLDASREVDLLVRGEQLASTDLAQVDADQVRGGPGAVEVRQPLEIGVVAALASGTARTGRSVVSSARSSSSSSAASGSATSKSDGSTTSTTAASLMSPVCPDRGQASTGLWSWSGCRSVGWPGICSIRGCRSRARAARSARPRAPRAGRTGGCTSPAPRPG